MTKKVCLALFLTVFYCNLYASEAAAAAGAASSDGINSNAVVARRAFLCAAFDEKEQEMKRLVEINPGLITAKSLKMGNIALHVAVRLCKETAVKILLAHNPSEQINVKNNSGRTPFHVACTKYDLGIVKLLLNVPGIDLNVQDADGDTPIHLAALTGHAGILHALEWCGKGARFDIRNNYGQSPRDCIGSETRMCMESIERQMCGGLLLPI